MACAGGMLICPGIEPGAPLICLCWGDCSGGPPRIALFASFLTDCMRGDVCGIAMPESGAIEYVGGYPDAAAVAMAAACDWLTP